MKKVFTVGGATQDIFLNFVKSDFMSLCKREAVSNFLLFEMGEKVEVDSLDLQVGGGATNSAVAFKRMGFDVASFCNIGDDCAGKTVLSDLQKNGVNSDFVSSTDEHKTGMSLVLNTQQGDRTILAYRGANGFMFDGKMPIEEIKKSDQLYITSLSHDSAMLLPRLTSEAKKAGVVVAINPGVSQLAKGTKILKDCLKNIDILILNSSEAQIFMHALVGLDSSYKKILESTSAQQACNVNTYDEKPYLIQSPIAFQDLYFSLAGFFKAVLKFGPKVVVVTNGINGVYVAKDDMTVYFHPSIKVEVTSTVGAGDAFGSCFVASLLHGQSIQDALRNGIINSASVLQHIGAKAGLLTQEQLAKKVCGVSKDLICEIKI
jgi:sugar/nucleoside kinase (ribokinase family)